MGRRRRQKCKAVGENNIDKILHGGWPSTRRHAQKIWRRQKPPAWRHQALASIFKASRTRIIALVPSSARLKSSRSAHFRNTAEVSYQHHTGNVAATNNAEGGARKKKKHSLNA